MTSRLLRLGLPCFVMATVASAQTTQFPFQLSASSGGNTSLVANGSTLGFAALLGSSQSAQITARYRGTGKVTITQQPELFGSTAFTVAFPEALPLSLNPGDTLFFVITYRPVSTAQTSAQIDLPFTESLPPATGSTAPTISLGDITFVLQGSTPSFTLSYILQTAQNVVPLQPGGTIPFAPTLINTSTQALLNITNLGTGPGQVTNVSITGNAFKLVGLPLFPDGVAAGSNLQLVVVYTPTAVGTDTGQIQVTFDPKTTFTIILNGSGVSSTFQYQVLVGATATTVSPGGSASVPDTNVGDATSVTIRVKNIGTANGIVNSINVVGPGFQLTSTEVLPQTLAPNASLTFTVAFTPTKPGQSTAQVIIGNDSFSLVGNGIGPNLVFSYVSGGNTITLTAANPTVVFSPVMISQSEGATFVVKNTGTQAATIANIGVGEANSPYALSGLPALPASLAPNKQLQFTITFTPTTTGFTNGTLHIDTAIVGLSGSGTAPPALPAYTIQGPSGNADPLSQPAVSLKLSAPYPLALAGTLTISIAGDLTSDPSVQFSTGGRTVPFVIPAKSTDAMFADQGTQIHLQTGTVASSITLTPSFLTQDGGVNVTPKAPTTLQFAIAAAAPILLAVQVTNTAASSLVLNISGFSTTRSLTAMNVQFTAAAGFNISTSQVTVDLTQAATNYFQSSGSDAFGGQFTISVPFTFAGTVGTGQTLIGSITAVSATVSNASGTSTSMQASVP